MLVSCTFKEKRGGFIRMLRWWKCILLVMCLVGVFQNTVLGSEIKVGNGVDFDQASLFPMVPAHIKIPAIGVDQDILEYTNKMVIEKGGEVDPDYLYQVAWWSGGGRPGATLANTTDTMEQNFTVYLYGHSTNNNSRKVVFDDIDLLETGDEIILETEESGLVYVVKEIFLIDKTDFTSDPRVVEDIPGRLLLISCWRSWSGSAPTSENVVVIANLSGLTDTN